MTRANFYIGPKEQIQPDKLPSFENGKWIAEEKIDGCWAAIETNPTGQISKLYSRTNVSWQVGLIGMDINLPNTVLAGELEVATQAATKLYQKLRYRRVWLFDVPVLLGQDTSNLPYAKRRELLEIAFNKINDKHICLVESKQDNFKKFFEDIKSNGGEGIVLKRIDSKYKRSSSDGKVDYWVRCKQDNTVDFYVIGLGKTPSGLDNLELGLPKDGKMCYVQSIAIPKGYKAGQLIGQVVECIGDYQQDSGALRHARLLRIRTDKEI